MNGGMSDGMRTKLRADFVIGYDGTGHVIWPKGEVVFSGDRIDYVGRAFPGDVDRTVDYGNAVIGPGFVDLDALGDLDSTILCFDNGPEWTIGRVWSEEYLRSGPAEAYSFDEQIFKYRYAFTQLLRNGITTALPITSMLYRAWAESYEEFAEVARLAGEIGIRAYLGPCYMSGLTYTTADGQPRQHWDEARGLKGLDEAARFFRDFDGSQAGLVRGMFAPDRIETCTPALLQRTAEVTRELDAPVRLHCCQSLYEFNTVLKLRQATPLGWLEKLGLLMDRAILPHGIYVSGHPQVSVTGDDDLKRLAGSGASIAHCPVVFARDGDALTSFGRYRARGINIGMGTDTFPPDMIDNMRQGLNLNHVMEGGRRSATSADFYIAATLGGAKALRRDDLGRLSAGARADITVFDLGGFHLGQFIDPIKTMVLSGNGRDFRDVYVNGRQVMQDHQVIGADYAALTRQADWQFRKVIETHRERAVGTPPLDTMFKSSFPVMTAE